MNKSKRLLPRFHRYMVNDDRKMHQKGTGLCILSGILIGLALGIMKHAYHWAGSRQIAQGDFPVW